jgi:hypothetical protein
MSSFVAPSPSLLTFVTLSQLSLMLLPVTPLPSSSTTARRLRICNGYNAIAQRHRDDGEDACASAAMTPSQQGQLKDRGCVF